jgi:hypothetical protein
MATLADRIAVGRSRLGVGRNDVVAMQLPNWWHFSLLYLACSRIGAVLNPLMPIFRERELSFMLGHGEAKALVVPKRFRNFDHEAMARGLQPNLPSLKRIIVVDGEGADDFDALLTAPEWEKQPDALPKGPERSDLRGIGLSSVRCDFDRAPRLAAPALDAAAVEFGGNGAERLTGELLQHRAQHLVALDRRRHQLRIAKLLALRLLADNDF